MSGTSSKRTSGFTLVELMIVVAIIGVLSAVAVPSFINYQMNSMRTEAFANLSAIARAQKSYYAEYDQFLSAATEPFSTTGLLPSRTKRNSQAFTQNIPLSFAAIGWAPEGEVYFDYDTATPAVPWAANCTCTESCFTSTAYGDLDGDLVLSAVIYAHPDTRGNFCDAGFGGYQPPFNAGGAQMLSEAALVPWPLAGKY